MSAPGAPEEQPLDATRRRALKLGAATGAAALVWTEPTIRGLATRPAYADAGSLANYAIPPQGPLQAGVGFPGALGNTLTLTLVDDLGGTIPTVQVDRAGCACTINSISPTTGSLLLQFPAGGGGTIDTPAVFFGGNTITFQSVILGGQTTATLAGATIDADCPTTP